MNIYLLEQLMELRMQEAQREAEQARLLREAGLSGEGWLARAAHALRHLLQARREASRDGQPAEPQSVNP